MNSERGRKGKEEKGEPVGMAQDGDSQTQVIYVMFKLTIQILQSLSYGLKTHLIDTTEFTV